MESDNENTLEKVRSGHQLPQSKKKYSGVRVISTRILNEISLLIGELAIRGTKLTLNAGLGTENKLLIEQYNIAIRRTLLYFQLNKRVGSWLMNIYL